MKDREFAKVALASVVAKLPGSDYDRSDEIMEVNEHFSLSGKLEVLDHLLKRFFREGSRVLLFAHSTQTLDLIQNYLIAVGTMEYRRMDGQTPLTKRQELADEFNRDSEIFLFLLSIKATGQGLTLTGANRVIMFDVDWNPSWEEQAQDRAHRIGQTRDVNVIRLVSKGTVEELTYLRQIYKSHLKQDTLQEANETHAAAPRVFRGVQGDKHRKGELFGTENLLKYKDGSFLDDIWAEANGTVASTASSDSSGIKIHQSTKLSELLLGIGGNLEYERKLAEDDDAATLQAMSNHVHGAENDKRRDLDVTRGSLEKKPTLSVDDTDSDGDDGGENKEPLEKKVRAVNHGDLFRSDRGNAAIPCEADAFAEEMGGQTQDAYAVYENTKDSTEEDEVHGTCNNTAEDDEDGNDADIPDVKLPRGKLENLGSGSGVSEAAQSLKHCVSSANDLLNHGGKSGEDATPDTAFSGRRTGVTPDEARTLNSRLDNAAHEESTKDPLPDTSFSLDDRRKLPSNVRSHGIETSAAESPKVGTSIKTNHIDIPNTQCNQGKRLSTSKYNSIGLPQKKKVPLVGLEDVETAATEFSIADLQLPTYTKTKRKKKKKFF